MIVSGGTSRQETARDELLAHVRESFAFVSDYDYPRGSIERAVDALLARPELLLQALGADWCGLLIGVDEFIPRDIVEKHTPFAVPPDMDQPRTCWLLPATGETP